MSNNNKGAILLASALTKIHPGAGRSPGIVDLPVIRDPLGYPFIPGTMLKGTIRSSFVRNDKDGDIIKCLFGPETGGQHAGSLTFHDLYPLFLPAPSSKLGVVYVTTHYLVARAKELLDSINIQNKNNFKDFLDKISSKIKDKKNLILFGKNKGSVDVGRVGAYMIGQVEMIGLDGDSSKKEDSTKENDISELHVLYKTIPVESRLLVIPPDMAVPVIESLLLRVTRVRLDPITKTSSGKGLWTEEYLPWGTFFVGAVVDNGFRGNSCKNLFNKNGPIDKLIKELLNNNVNVIVIGGKETVGGGVLKVKLL